MFAGDLSDDQNLHAAASAGIVVRRLDRGIGADQRRAVPHLNRIGVDAHDRRGSAFVAIAVGNEIGKLCDAVEGRGLYKGPGAVRLEGENSNTADGHRRTRGNGKEVGAIGADLG